VSNPGRRTLARRLLGAAARRCALAGDGAAHTSWSAERGIGVGRLASERSPATHLLFARLSDSDVAAVEQAIAADAHLALQYSAPRDEVAREQMVLTFGAWLDSEPLLSATGLSAVQPPETVHAMARGPLAAAGGLYEADLVADALASAGVEISALGDGLDFGCSSGRVLRVLASAYPEVSWRGCDPNDAAIAWAQSNLPGIEFFPSPSAPPLALPDRSLDLVYAISIWSHFAPLLGKRWFDEMHRVLRPGGHLVCTTHGLTSIAHYARLGERSLAQSREIAQQLYRLGWWYRPEFGEHGDWGVVDPEWGTSFLAPEWVIAQLCPRWSVVEFAAGRNQDNQDVYVLQRA
jgi:SAM-dependent methyltransferase